MELSSKKTNRFAHRAISSWTLLIIIKCVTISSVFDVHASTTSPNPPHFLLGPELSPYERCYYQYCHVESCPSWRFPRMSLYPFHAIMQLRQFKIRGWLPDHWWYHCSSYIHHLPETRQRQDQGCVILTYDCGSGQRVRLCFLKIRSGILLSKWHSAIPIFVTNRIVCFDGVGISGFKSYNRPGPVLCLWADVFMLPP